MEAYFMKYGSIVKITLKTNITIPAQAADEVLRIISKLLTTIIHIPH